MKEKVVIIIFTVILIIAVIIFIMKKTNKIEVEKEVEEFIPAQEITDEQDRNTIVTLYFVNNANNELVPEARNVDVKALMENPYDTIIEMLIGGPINKDSISYIPDNTRIINTYLENDILIIDLSTDFLEIQNEKTENQKIIIESILKSMCQLKEVNGIRILIEGESNVELKNSGINLSDEKR